MSILKLIAVFFDMVFQTGFYIFPVLALCALGTWKQPGNNVRRDWNRLAPGLAFALAFAVILAVRLYGFAGMTAFTRRYLVVPAVLLLIPAAIGGPIFVRLLDRGLGWLLNRLGKGRVSGAEPK